MIDGDMTLGEYRHFFEKIFPGPFSIFKWHLKIMSLKLPNTKFRNLN